MKKILFLSAAFAAFVAGSSVQAHVPAEPTYFVGVGSTYTRTYAQGFTPSDVQLAGVPFAANAVANLTATGQGMQHADIFGGEVMFGQKRPFSNCANWFWGMRGYLGMTGGKIKKLVGVGFANPQGTPAAGTVVVSGWDNGAATVDPTQDNKVMFGGAVQYAPVFNTGLDLVLGRSVSEAWAVYGGFALDITVGQVKTTGAYQFIADANGNLPGTATAITGVDGDYVAGTYTFNSNTNTTFSVVPHVGVAYGVGSNWAVFVDAGYKYGLVNDRPASQYGFTSRPHGFKLTLGATYSL